jgi:hypothetical protein
VNINWKLFYGELKIENLILNKFYAKYYLILIGLKMKNCCGVFQQQIEKYENFVTSKAIIFSGMCILLNLFCGAQFGYNNVFIF